MSLRDFAGSRVRRLLLPGRRHARDAPRRRASSTTTCRAFARAGVAVLGISPDGAEQAPALPDQVRARFPLLSDTDHEVMERYGAYGEKTMYGKKTVGVIRSTFMVGPDGKIQRAWYNVRADGHAARRCWPRLARRAPALARALASALVAGAPPAWCGRRWCSARARSPSRGQRPPGCALGHEVPEMRPAAGA